MLPDLRPVTPAGLGAFHAYLEDHFRDNGEGDTPLFQPQPRGVGWQGPHRARTALRLVASLDDEDWYRAWVAVGPGDAIVGHVDLQACRGPCAPHRAQLALGVHRDHRGRGLGGLLLDLAVQWAAAQPSLAWIDLEHLGGNDAAHRLYVRAGFHVVAVVPDRFRIDGASVDDVWMSLRLREGT